MSTTILTRRRFLKQVGGMAGASAFATALGMHKMAAAAPLTDYKALVCLFLYGGNDGNATVVPRTGTAYTKYAAARGPLAIPAASILPISPTTAQGIDLGFPAYMAEMQTLFQQKHLAVLNNVGPLVAPITRAQFQAETVPVPPNLFAHDEQQEQWQSLLSYSPNAQLTGWGGRTADLLRSLNGSSQVSMSISLAGSNILQIGKNVVQYQMHPGGTFALDTYTPGANDETLVALKTIFAQSRTNMLDTAWLTKMNSALATEQALSTSLAAAPAIATVFPSGNLSAQLKMVARLISISGALGIKRQVFFVGQGGFDTHGDQNIDHPVLLRNVSKSLDAFYKATVEIGAASQVTTFTGSDFGRTLTNNEQGTDHAWGSHQFIMGGAVKGGDCYGTYPTIELGGQTDAGNEGRWIPTTSCDQLSATLAKWFGVSPTNIPLVVPNISRFATSDLGFML